MWHTQSEWEEVIRRAVTKLEGGAELGEEELRALACEVQYSPSDECRKVAEYEGDDHRWHREASTVIEAHGHFWRIDWMTPLTETAEAEFWDQPVEVRPVTRVIPAHEVTEYVEVGE